MFADIIVYLVETSLVWKKIDILMCTVVHLMVHLLVANRELIDVDYVVLAIKVEVAVVYSCLSESVVFFLL